MTRRGRHAWASLWVLPALVAACGRPGPVPPGPTPVRTPLADGAEAGLPVARSLAGRGQLAYRELCAECHGATGAGDGPGRLAVRNAPTNFLDAGHMLRQRPTWYYRAITEGVVGSGMGSWDHRLDAGTRWDTAFYVWSLAIPAEAYRQGEQRYRRDCAECHGGDGRGAPEAPLDAPALADLSRAETAARLRAVHPELVPARAGDLAALVAYLGTFLYEPVGP